ncbi:hypothetical protein [Sorangium cellulosum]|uniref:Uncharacterized protein n=1 Tax=Sorangium cellulosum So0157-2 TaxID=1254432 RepID=S4XU20_SORCE|nr:hypothetical protein [Sorangium cellulosum]AGP34093.1 hypothetical protein SCE1572_06045 [Sorangium cellulosum So0157-2]
MPTDEPSATDPYLDEVVERALAPYRGIASRDVIEAMRELLVEALTEDEVGRDLLERARPRAAPLGSGIEAREGAAAPRRKAGGGEDG